MGVILPGSQRVARGEATKLPTYLFETPFVVEAKGLLQNNQVNSEHNPSRLASHFVVQSITQASPAPGFSPYETSASNPKSTRLFKLRPSWHKDK